MSDAFSFLALIFIFAAFGVLTRPAPRHPSKFIRLSYGLMVPALVFAALYVAIELYYNITQTGDFHR